MNGFVCVIERCGITGTVGKKNPVGIESQHFVSRCASRHHGHVEPFLPEQAQNIFLYAVVVCGNSGADCWQGLSVSSVRGFLDRPWGAEFILRVPTIDFCR